MDSKKIIGQERNYLANNEPTFYQEGSGSNYFVGKVGRMPTGEDIRIGVNFPDFYPIVKPEITVLTPMEHPNVDIVSGSLDLELLAFWEPKYRVKDILSATRRLFVRSQVKPVMRKTSVVDVRKTSGETNRLEVITLQNEISRLQNQIKEFDQKIANSRKQNLNNHGVDLSRNIETTPKLEYQAELQAVDDLLELLEIKFEEAEINTIEFARLYRRYSAKRFIAAYELEKIGGKTNELQNKKKTKIAN